MEKHSTRTQETLSLVSPLRRWMIRSKSVSLPLSLVISSLQGLSQTQSLSPFQYQKHFGFRTFGVQNSEGKFQMHCMEAEIVF